MLRCESIVFQMYLYSSMRHIDRKRQQCPQHCLQCPANPCFNLGHTNPHLVFPIVIKWGCTITSPTSDPPLHLPSFDTKTTRSPASIWGGALLSEVPSHGDASCKLLLGLEKAKKKKNVTHSDWAESTTSKTLPVGAPEFYLQVPCQKARSNTMQS